MEDMNLRGEEEEEEFKREQISFLLHFQHLNTQKSKK